MPNLAALKAQLRIQDQAAKEVTAKSNRIDKRRKQLRERIKQAQLKALGLVSGARYLIVPKDRPGDILEGVFKRFSTVKWSGTQYAIFRCPQTGRFKEMIRHLNLDEWEFERVNKKEEAS